MAEMEIPRANIRLRLDRGTALLSQTGITAITCNLEDLSEGGCKCRVMLDAFELEARDAWKRGLTTGRILSVELSAPPHLVDFKIEANIRWVNLVTDATLDLGVSFCALGPEHLKLLRKTMMTLANDKLKVLKAGPPPSAPTEVPDIVPLPEPKKAGKSSGAGLPSVKPPATPVSGPIPIFPPRTPNPPLSRTPAKSGSSGNNAAVSGSGRVMVVPIPSHAEPPALNVEPEITASGRVRRLGDLRGKKLTDVLTAMGKINETRAAEVEALARAESVPIEQFILRSDIVKPLELCRALALQTGLPMIGLEGMRLPTNLLQLFPFATMDQHEFIPFESTETLLSVAAPMPLHWRVINELQEGCGRTIQIFLAPSDQVRKTLDGVHEYGVKLQRQKRYKAFLPAVYQFCDEEGVALEEETHEGHTLDFNEGGFKMEGPAPSDALLKRNVCLIVQISSPTTGMSVMGICRIRVVDPIKDKHWIYGLQILKMTEEDRTTMRDMYVRASLSQQYRK